MKRRKYDILSMKSASEASFGYSKQTGRDVFLQKKTQPVSVNDMKIVTVCVEEICEGLLEQVWFQMDIIWRDGVHSHYLHQPLHIFVARRDGFIGAFAVQTGSFYAVDVVHQQMNVVVGIGVQVAAFGNYIAYVLVIFFQFALLPRCHRIAVEQHTSLLAGTRVLQ